MDLDGFCLLIFPFFVNATLDFMSAGRIYFIFSFVLCLVTVSVKQSNKESSVGGRSDQTGGVQLVLGGFKNTESCPLASQIFLCIYNHYVFATTFGELQREPFLVLNRVTHS